MTNGCHAQAFSGYKLQTDFRTYHSSSPSCSYSWIKSFTRVVRFRTALPHCYRLLANFTSYSLKGRLKTSQLCLRWQVILGGVFFPGDCWKLSYRTCRLSQGLSTQQRGILNCDYFWRYKYKVMYHYLSTTVIWWLQVTTPHLRTRMFSSQCRPCRRMRGQHRVFGCWTPRGRKHGRFEAYAQRQQWDTEAAQSDQKDDLSMVWLIELCWSPILQGELCTGSCFNVKLIQSDVWFGKPIDLDGNP